MKNHTRPTKKFSQKRYITLTKDDTLKVLDLYNAITDMLNDVGETFDAVSYTHLTLPTICSV